MVLIIYWFIILFICLYHKLLIITLSCNKLVEIANISHWTLQYSFQFKAPIWWFLIVKFIIYLFFWIFVGFNMQIYNVSIMKKLIESWSLISICHCIFLLFEIIIIVMHLSCVGIICLLPKWTDCCL